MAASTLRKIISGGQTGVDRAALDAAIYLELEHGGWCPRGRRAEDGPISEIYQLIETSEQVYSVRTEKNVVDSDGTLILFRDQLRGGTELTVKLAKKHKRPLLCLNLVESYATPAAAERASTQLRQWLVEANIGVLNVAGPRESNSKGIAREAELFLVAALDVAE